MCCGWWVVGRWNNNNNNNNNNKNKINKWLFKENIVYNKWSNVDIFVNCFCKVEKVDY